MAFQHDAVGLITFDTAVRDRVPPRQGPGHLRVLMEKLEKTQPGGETSLSETFHQLAETIKRRALVVVLSDLFDDPDELVGALKHFRHKKHEVIVFQMLDPAEVTFPFDDVTRIEDMENAPRGHQRPAGLPQGVPRGVGQVPRDRPRRLPRRQIDYVAGPDRPAVRPVPGHLPGPAAGDDALSARAPRMFTFLDRHLPEPALPDRPAVGGDPAHHPPEPVAAHQEDALLDHALLHRPVPALLPHEPAQGTAPARLPHGPVRPAGDGPGPAALAAAGARSFLRRAARAPSCWSSTTPPAWATPRTATPLLDRAQRRRATSARRPASRATRRRSCWPAGAQPGPEVALPGADRPTSSDVRQAVDRLQVATLGTDLTGAVPRPRTWSPGQRRRPSKEVYVLSDLQDSRLGACRRGRPTRRTAPTCRFFFVRVRPEETVDQPWRSRRCSTPRPGRWSACRSRFGRCCAWPGDDAQATCDVRLFVDGDKVGEQKVEKLPDGRWAVAALLPHLHDRRLALRLRRGGGRRPCRRQPPLLRLRGARLGQGPGGQRRPVAGAAARTSCSSCGWP